MKHKRRFIPLDAISITDKERSSERSEQYSETKNLELADVMGNINGLSGMRGKRVEEVVEEFEEYQSVRETTSPRTVIVKDTSVDFHVKGGLVNEESCKFYKQEKTAREVEELAHDEEELELEDSRIDFR